MALACKHCGKGVNSLDRKAKHERVCGLGAPTTSSGHTRSHSTSESQKCDQESVTEETSNTNTELPVTQAPESHSVTLSTTDSPSEVQGVTRSQKCDPECDPDPMAEIKDAALYLNARRDYLDRWELGFIGSVVFIVLSKTNGDRARHLTPDMVAKLFETRAKVEALEARDKAEAEYDRVQRHFTDMKLPGHVPCDLCEKERQSRIEGARVQEECRARDEAILEETRQRKEREESERLEASRIVERRDPNALRREIVRKRLAARSAATTGAENGRPTDA